MAKQAAPRYLDITLDEYLAQSAAKHPRKLALRYRNQKYTFLRFNKFVNRAANVFWELTQGKRTPIAMSGTLNPEYAICYYGVLRSGNTNVPVIPFLREPELQHVLNEAEAEIVVVTGRMYEVLKNVRHNLPKLRQVIVYDADKVEKGDLKLKTLLNKASDEFDQQVVNSLDDVANIQFTSGTTGLPKGALLTHRNLAVNAVQVSAAHGITPKSVTMNSLPTYHLMHLNSTLVSGASQILCDDMDDAVSIHLANECKCTHYYSLPVRLARLLNNPLLPELKLETVQVIASGGSALNPNIAEALTKHFGIPVVQGYGLAETSPLVASMGIGVAPKRGTVGLPCFDTQLRIVDIDTGRELATGETGEVEIKGPQVMKGYKEASKNEGAYHDGWLTTGDIGYLDEDNYLFIVDRKKDIFKCDNWIVSPSEIEALLMKHPAVKDCAVAEHADLNHGAVAHAFVVLKDPNAKLDDIVQFVNDQVAYFKQIQYIDVIETIPRSGGGKVLRRNLKVE